MATALLLRSLARKMARAPPAHHHPLLARGLHGSGPGASSLTKPPARFQQGQGDHFGAGAAGLRSLATKVARAPPPPHHRLLHAQRGLHGLNSTTPPPTSKIDFAKITAGVAYVALFGSLAYLYGSLLPRVARLEGILEGRKQLKMDAALATEAQIKQSSATRAEHGKHPAGKGTELKDLEAEVTQLKLAYEAAQKERIEILPSRPMESER